MNLPSGITTIPRSKYYDGHWPEDTSDFKGDVYFYFDKKIFECSPFEKGFVIDWLSSKQPTVDQTLNHIRNFLKERPSWYLVATVHEMVRIPMSRQIERPFIYWLINFSTDQFIKDVTKYWGYRRAHLTFTDHIAGRYGSFWFNMSKGNWSPSKGMYLDTRPLPKEFAVAYMLDDLDFIEPAILRQILDQLDT